VKEIYRNKVASQQREEKTIKKKGLLGEKQSSTPKKGKKL